MDVETPTRPDELGTNAICEDGPVPFDVEVRRVCTSILLDLNAQTETLADRYVQAAGRRTPTPMDKWYAGRYAVRRWARDTDPRSDERVLEMHARLVPTQVTVPNPIADRVRCEHPEWSDPNTGELHQKGVSYAMTEYMGFEEITEDNFDRFFGTEPPERDPIEPFHRADETRVPDSDRAFVVDVHRAVDEWDFLETRGPHRTRIARTVRGMVPHRSFRCVSCMLSFRSKAFRIRRVIHVRIRSRIESKRHDASFVLGEDARLDRRNRRMGERPSRADGRVDPNG